MGKIKNISPCFIGLLILSTCAASGSAQGEDGDLTGKVWALTELEGKALVRGTGITALFTSNRSISGSAGCNRYNGKYTVSGRKFTVSTPLAMTRMACPQPVMDQETAYLKMLGNAKTYTVSGDQLTLFGNGNQSLAVYQAQSQDLAGTSWEVIGYNNGKEAVTSVLANTTLTANFDKAGNLSGNAGCNDYSSPYKVTGNQIKIGPVSSTMKACADPAGVMDQEAQYLAALDTASTYSVEGSVLELRTADGALAVQYSKK